MKRLFILLYANGRTVLDGDGKTQYFTDKMKAKEYRNQKNESDPSNLVHVAKGPDHMGTHGISSRSRKQRKLRRKKS